MKRIKTSAIAPGAAMPFKGGMLDLVQDNVKETDNRILRAFNYQYSSNPTILFGGYTLVGGTYQISAGALHLNGEVYQFASINVTPGVGQVVVGTITEVSQSGAGLDPVQFSNAANNNVNMDRIIVWSSGASGSGDVNLSACKFSMQGYPNPYNAGLLFASTGTWTLPGGAVDFQVFATQMGCKVIVDFEITNGTLSNNTSNFSFDLAILTGGTFSSANAIRDTYGFAFMTNGNNTPANEIVRVKIGAGDNRIYFERVDNALHAAITGGLDVFGQLIFEADFGFNS